MAGMRLFGRRCTLATDDFFFIGIIHFIIYLPWLGWIPIIYASFLKQRTGCQDKDVLLLLDISLPGLCALYFFNWLLSALFVIFSARGTLSNPEPRRHVVTLLYIKLFVSLLDMAWASLGTYILFENNYCEIFGVGLVIKACTIFQWLVTIVRLTMMIMFCDTSAGKRPKEREINTLQHFTTPARKGSAKKWNLRLQALFMMCTTATEERKQAYKTASQLLSLLSCDLDYTVSDMLASLLIARRKSVRLWKTEKALMAAFPPISTADGQALEKFPPDDFEPWMNLKEAYHYFNLGLGVFGWWWFMFKNCCCGCCILVRHLKCCFPFRKRAHIVEGDNCCGCDVAGLQLTTNLLYEDLILVSYRDNVFELPFFVTYDHETKAVLVTARGTMSMNDVLTDCAATFDSMDDPGIPEGAVCHGGFITTARVIKKKLDERHILEDAFSEKPDYQLIFNGHSLGAAVASVLTLLYKHQYPDVKCYAFAPPPTINKTVLPYAEKSIFAIYYGNDVVPCMKYENVKKLIMEMEQNFHECNLPKYKVFISTNHINKDLENIERNSSISNTSVSNGSSAPLTNGSNGIQPSELVLARSISVSQPIREEVCTETSFVAGKILHIYPKKDRYILRLPDREEYDRIIFRPRMILDHVPIFIEKALKELSKYDVLDESSLRKPSVSNTPTN